MKLLPIIDPQRDGRLSWTDWMTHSEQFTHRVTSCQQSIGRRSAKVCRPKTDIVTTEVRHQPISQRLKSACVVRTLEVLRIVCDPVRLLLLLGSLVRVK